MNAEQQAAAGCPPEMVRLSIGLETYTDILEDIDQALTNVLIRSRCSGSGHVETRRRA